MQVLVNERCVKALALVNSGLLKFDYIWKVGTRALHFFRPLHTLSTPDALHLEGCCLLPCGSLVASPLHTAARMVQHDSWVWQVGEDPRVSVDPAAGMVGKGGRSVCRLCYNPHSAHTLSSYKVTCQVVNGSTYTLLLSGGTTVG